MSRQSTTVCLTRATIRQIWQFCLTTGQGVILRHKGQEIGVTSDDFDDAGNWTTCPASKPGQCTIPRLTLNQISGPVLNKAQEQLKAYAVALDMAYRELSDFRARRAEVAPRQRIFLEQKLTAETDKATSRLCRQIERMSSKSVETVVDSLPAELVYVFDGV